MDELKHESAGAAAPEGQSGGTAPAVREHGGGTGDSALAPAKPGPAGTAQVHRRSGAGEKHRPTAQGIAADAAALERQLGELSRLEPGMRSVADVLGQENYPELLRLVRRGLTLTEAYKLANHERLTRQAAEAARRQTLTRYAGKAHLTATAVRGSGQSEVPPEVAEQYRLLNPGITDAEMQAHYRSHHHKKG